MSSAGAPGGAAAPAGQQRYFCHQCDRTVVLTPDPSSDLSCPLCGGGFIEEFDLPANPNPSPSPNASPFLAFSSSSLGPFFPSSSAPIIFSAPPSFDLRRPSDLAGLLGTDASPRSRDGGGPEPFNPMFFLQNYLNSLVAGGANIQVVLEGGPPAGGSLGDYFIGPGLEQFIQQLAENDPNRHGTPPASKSAIQALPDVVISAQLLASDEAQCAVCKDTFEMGAEAKQMPCKHIYHKDCILPWLELHNSCPVCRYELPTDDPDYEQRRGVPPPAASGPGSSGGSGGSGGSDGAGATSSEGNSPLQRMERRFRVSLPWPLRMFGSQAQGSNPGGGSSNDGSARGGNSGSGGDGDPRLEPRHEDID